MTWKTFKHWQLATINFNEQLFIPLTYAMAL